MHGVCKACGGTKISSKGTECIPCVLNTPLSLPVKREDKKLSHSHKTEQHIFLPSQERFVLSEREVVIKRR